MIYFNELFSAFYQSKGILHAISAFSPFVI